MREITFTIPGSPVSANASRKPRSVAIVTPCAQKVHRGRVYKASGAALYQSTVYGLSFAVASAVGWSRPYYVAVTLEVFNVQQDVDNVPKCILDGMQGVIYDHDSRIKRLLVVRERDKKGPRVVVHVRALGYAECRLRGWIIPKAFRVEP